jgi:hypothetical protein
MYAYAYTLRTVDKISNPGLCHIPLKIKNTFHQKNTIASKLACHLMQKHVELRQTANSAQNPFLKAQFLSDKHSIQEFIVEV